MFSVAVGNAKRCIVKFEQAPVGVKVPTFKNYQIVYASMMYYDLKKRKNIKHEPLGSVIIVITTTNQLNGLM